MTNLCLCVCMFGPGVGGGKMQGSAQSKALPSPKKELQKRGTPATTMCHVIPFDPYNLITQILSSFYR